MVVEMEVFPSEGQTRVGQLQIIAVVTFQAFKFYRCAVPFGISHI